MPEHDKWQLFRAICTARLRVGVTDRDLTVLNALLSFYPGATLKDGAGLVVFPSNAALAERAHGMAESTLRRHLAALVRAGVILRHDSPNGKRYAARDADGTVQRAFGFDLRPLLVRAAEFAEAARQVTAETQDLKRRREACVLMLRDASKLAAYAQEEGLGSDWTTLHTRLADARRALRRKLTTDDIAALAADLREVLGQVEALLATDVSEEMDANTGQNERHYQNSKPDSYESEPCQEKGRGQMSGDAPARHKPGGSRLPLAVVLKACPDLRDFVSDEIRQWHHLVNAADTLRGMMGISVDAWHDARRAMGDECAAIAVACMLQRMGHINSPGGYLRSLTRKAEEGAFSVSPMVMALLNGANRVPA